MKAQHHILMPAVIILLMAANGCSSPKKGLAQQEPEFTAERVELTGYRESLIPMPRPRPQ